MYEARRVECLSHVVEIPVLGIPARRIAAETNEQVVLPPHHALRSAGRAAGVQEEQVVAAAPT